jgi:hypothetical protein
MDHPLVPEIRASIVSVLTNVFLGDLEAITVNFFAIATDLLTVRFAELDVGSLQGFTLGQMYRVCPECESMALRY